MSSDDKGARIAIVNGDKVRVGCVGPQRGFV